MISKFKAFQGPVQFVFKDPDTGMLYGPELSKKALLDRVTIFRQQNNLPEIEFLGDVVENYWCSLPENAGRCEVKIMPLGLLATIRGGVAVIKNYMYKSFVPQEVAETRASQCSTCKYNDLREDKAWCDIVALHSVGGKRTSHYDELGKCVACSCVLNMKVFYDGKIPKPGPETMAAFNEVNCWQKDIIE